MTRLPPVDLAMPAASWAGLLVVALLLPACADSPQVDPAATGSAGRLVMVGGALGDDNAEVYEAVLEGREGDGPFCVIPTASGVPERSMAASVAAFREHGADSVDGIFLTTETPGAASDPETVARLRACSGFWFTGGVQSRVVRVFRPGGKATPGYEALMERFQAGAVVAGTSAGAAIMPPVMIAGGASANALANGTVHGDDAGDDDPEGVLLEPGMGFYQGAVVDQHFLARGRIGRLLVAALAGTGGGVGLGIDENTAVVVDGARAQVVGASGVVLVDARSARATDTGQGAREVPVHLLGAGDGLDLETLRVTPASGKEPVTVTSGGVSAPDDLFASWTFLHLLDDLAASEVDSTSVSASGYRITMEKAPGFQARSFQSEGVEGTPYGLSAGPFLVSLAPED